MKNPEEKSEKKNPENRADNENHKKKKKKGVKPEERSKDTSLDDINHKKQEPPLIQSAEFRLALVSFLVLFFELACIRWVPSYIRYLSFFSNFVLLACFLGMGIGLLTARRKTDLYPWFPPLLLIFIAIVSVVKFELDFNPQDTIYFKDAESGFRKTESYLLLPFVFIMITAIFAFICQKMGRLFSKFEPLKAYSLNIGGSLVGIAAFFMTSYLQIKPIWWFVVSAVVAVVLMRKNFKKIAIAVVCFAIVCGIVFNLQGESIWSPYYKITLHKASFGGMLINVNNIGHQVMSKNEFREPFYHVPYQSFNNNHYDDVLIIGAGSGSDTAMALEYGANNITAVEIDPVIYNLGKNMHPEHPYTEPNVEMHINDARVYLKNADKKFDLIIFALPDSLTLTSSFANLRLESYLFTLESFREAKKRLKPGGLLVLYNYYREDWLINKIAGMLEETFDEKPVVVKYPHEFKAAVFMAGDRLKDLKEPMPRSGGDPTLTSATDDWPFIYMKSPTMPPVFLKALAMIIIFAFAVVFFVKPKGTGMKLSGHFFFLGAAFMLLETSSIVRFSLLFGGTWMTSSLVFFAILFMVLLAVWISFRFKIERLWILYALLFVVFALNYFLPLEKLLVGSPVLRYVLTSLMVFSPIFIANLIFAQTFREEKGATEIALASNILGSFIGGTFEYSSLLLGYKNLVLIAALFYVISFILVNIEMKKPGKA